MLRKTIIAASAALLLIAAGTSAASAKVHVDLNLGIAPGYPVYVPQPQPYYPAYDDGYDDYDGGDCGYEYISVKKWNRYHSRYRIEHRRVWVCN